MPSASSIETPRPISSPTQATLLEWLRADARIACAPTLLLPARATLGVECRPNGRLVALVGVYAFRSEDDAFRTYRERLAEFGIGLRTGDCRAGKAGDASWLPGDGMPGVGDQPTRSGCYLGRDGLANVRVTCGFNSGVYIGIAGKTADLESLYRWVDQIPQAALAAGLTPSPPGICYGSALWGS